METVHLLQQEILMFSPVAILVLSVNFEIEWGIME